MLFLVYFVSYYIGEIAELVANMMVNRGYKVRFPAIVTEEDGSQHIEEYCDQLCNFSDVVHIPFQLFITSYHLAHFVDRIINLVASCRLFI